VNPEGPGAAAVDLPVIHLWSGMHETPSVSSTPMTTIKVMNRLTYSLVI
jgi:hypothetical protein